jgi:hypothetical protein
MQESTTSRGAIEVRHGAGGGVLRGVSSAWFTRLRTWRHDPFVVSSPDTDTSVAGSAPTDPAVQKLLDENRARFRNTKVWWNLFFVVRSRGTCTNRHGPVSGESLVWPAALVLLRFGPPNLKDSRVGRDSRRETLPSALPWPFFRLPLAGVEWGVDCIVHVCKLPVWAPRLAFLPLRPPGSAHHGRAGSDRLAESTMTPSRGDCERGAGVTSLA